MAEAPSAPATPTGGQQQAPATPPQARAPGGQFQPGKQLPIEQQAAQPQPGQQEKPPGETPESKRIRLRLEADREEEFDESTLAGLVKRGKNSAQLMSKAQQRFADAEKRAADVDAKLARIKSDPFGVLRELGVDPRGLSEQEILRAIEEEKERALPPEERALRERARKADEYERQLKEREDKAKQDEEDAETEHHRQAFDTVFSESLQIAGLPKTSVRRAMPYVAQLYKAMLEAGEEPSPQDAAAHAVEGLRAEQRALIQGMSVEELNAWLGDDVMKAVRKHDLERYRAQRNGGGVPPPKPPPEPKPAPKVVSKRGRWDLIDQYVKE
jgi:hypothetical protein